MKVFFDVMLGGPPLRVAKAFCINKDGTSTLQHEFGSEEFFASVECGDVPLHVAEGKILSRNMSGMNDVYAFQMLVDGEEKTWEIPGGESSYRIGREARVEYFLLRPGNWLTVPYGKSENEPLEFAFRILLGD